MEKDLGVFLGHVEAFLENIVVDRGVEWRSITKSRLEVKSCCGVAAGVWRRGYDFECGFLCNNFLDCGVEGISRIQLCCFRFWFLWIEVEFFGSGEKQKREAGGRGSLYAQIWELVRYNSSLLNSLFRCGLIAGHNVAL